MKRRLLNLLTVLSLVLCVAAGALWVRGTMCFDEWEWADVKVTGFDDVNGTEAATFALFGNGDGVAAASWGTTESVGSARRGHAPRRGWRRETRSYPPDIHLHYFTDRDWIGFGWESVVGGRGALGPTGVPVDRDKGYEKYWDVTVKVPLWAPLLLGMAMPGARLGRRLYHVLRSRHLEGRCARCGYDLRATPGRCPECGAVAVTTG